MCIYIYIYIYIHTYTRPAAVAPEQAGGGRRGAAACGGYMSGYMDNCVQYLHRDLGHVSTV